MVANNGYCNLQGDEIYKTVFVAFFQGERLKNRVKKICEGFHASVYPCSHSFEERQKMLKDVNQRLKDLKTVSVSLITVFLI